MRMVLVLTAMAIMSWLIAPPVLQAAPVVVPEKRSERPQLKSIYAETHDLGELVPASTPAVVFAFLGVDCPVAQQYLPTFRQLYERFKHDGVLFYGVYPNARVHVVAMAAHAHDHAIPFPVFLDVGHRLADLLEVEVTPEVVVLDGRLEKHYQGAIDNQFKRRGRIGSATENYLEDALSELVNRQAVTRRYASPSGCPIERLAPPPPNSNLTYHRDIAPLIRNHCETCHREGGVAPFELVTFEDVYYTAERIRDNVRDRRMPPWHGFLNPAHGQLAGDRRLNDQQIQAIVDWVRIGAPEGDPADAPPPVQWPSADAWEIGQPDFVYRIPGFQVPKHGVIDYQFFRVPLNFETDRWFNAVEVKPGQVDVVHHVGLHVVPSSDKQFTGFSGMAELYGLNSEGAILINDYVPGDTYNAKVYPPGQAVRISKGSDLIFEVHYTPNNRSTVLDRSMVAFRWADQPPRDEVFTKVTRTPVGRFRIPPHAHHHRMQDSFYFEHDVLLDAIRPHFHLRGKAFRVERIERDPETDAIVRRDTILSVPVWDPDWQRTYELKTPLHVLAGTELLASGDFDNSRLNPNNPDPSATVEWGQQTHDEMFSTRFKYRVFAPTDK